MTILCVNAPHFLFALEARKHGWDAQTPAALLGPDGRVWAASPVALAGGALPGLSARLARARCPDLTLRALDLAAADAAQSAFNGVLARTGLPVEPAGAGAAYCDLSAVAATPGEAGPVCADLGAQIRRELGVALTPALGVNCGKFTARAAAASVQPGRMRLINRADEPRFLALQPLALLPLPPEALQQLRWLGLRTLADFARLPAASVAARFGAAGKLAHLWAQGRDSRPVRALTAPAPEPLVLDFETPCPAAPPAAAAATRALRPLLAALAVQLQGCNRLRLDLRFIDHGAQTHTHVFPQATCALADVSGALSRALTSQLWPAELVSLRIALLDMAELAPQVWTLFGELGFADGKQTAPFARLAGALALRHAGALWQAEVVDPAHPAAERRSRWSALAP